MSDFSTFQLKAMKAAFVNLFNVSAEIAETQAVVDWMTNAPVGIVEYDSPLQNETKADQDARMEMNDVYNSNYAKIVAYLKKQYPERKSLTKWELLFAVYNDIMSAQEAISQATTELAFSDNNAGSQEPVVEEPVQSDLTDSKPVGVGPAVSEPEPVIQPEVVESVNEEVVHEVENSVTVEPPTPVVQENTSVETYTDIQPVVNSLVENGLNESVVETPAEPDSLSVEKQESQNVSETGLSGNVEEQTVAPLSNTSSNQSYNKEENEMADTNSESAVEALLREAQGSNVVPPSPAEEQKAPSSNVSTSKADLKAAQEAVLGLMGSQVEQKTAWTREHTFSAVIAPQRAAALRVKAQDGYITKETDSDKITKAVDGKITNFIQLVSGVKGLTVEKFEQMTADQRYANVVDGKTKVNEVEITNREKVTAMYELLKAVKQNPTAPIPAYIPQNPSVPIKGYRIGSENYPNGEFMALLADVSNGAVYGEGSITPEGVEKEKAVSVRLSIASKTEKAPAKTITTQTVTKKVPVARIKNKKEFLTDPNHIIYLFTKEDATEDGRASFRAAIGVNGVLTAATVPVYSRDEKNNKIVVSHDDKTNTDKYKTRQASISVSVPVTKILKEFSPEFKGPEEDPVYVANRWDIKMGNGATGNFALAKNLSETPVFDVFSQIYAGNVVIPGALKNSTAIQALRAAANEQAASDAAQAATDLA